MSSRFDQIRNPHYTDLAILIGPYTSWVEYAYVDLQRYAPEVLLGYRVRLATADSAFRHHLRGYRASKLVVLDGIQSARDANLGLMYAHMTLLDPTKVEWYRVHRGSNPVVQRLGTK